MSLRNRSNGVGPLKRLAMSSAMPGFAAAGPTEYRARRGDEPFAAELIQQRWRVDGRDALEEGGELGQDAFAPLGQVLRLQRRGQRRLAEGALHVAGIIDAHGGDRRFGQQIDQGVSSASEPTTCPPPHRAATARSPTPRAKPKPSVHRRVRFVMFMGCLRLRSR